MIESNDVFRVGLLKKEGGLFVLPEKIPENKLTIANKEIGCNLTLSDYIHVMYPKVEECGYVALAHKEYKATKGQKQSNKIKTAEEVYMMVLSGVKEKDKPYDFVQRSYPVNELLDHVELSKDCYTSMNTFYIKRRQKSDIRHLNALFTDIDYYNVGVTIEEVLQALDFYVQKELIPSPTFVIDSGRGVYFIWKIEDVPGRFVRATRLYMAVQEYIYDLFKDIGADVNARDVSRVLRLPASTNTKVDNQVEVIQYNEKALYTLRFFQEYLLDKEEVCKLKEKRTKPKEKRKSKIARLFNEYTLHVARIRDIERLCSLRNYAMTGLRDQVVYIYYYYNLLVHQDKNIALYKTMELNDKFTEPLTREEVKSYIVSADRSAKEKQEGKAPSKGYKQAGYNFKNETLIKIFNITEEEQKQLSTIISKREKYDRNNIRRRKVGTRNEYLEQQKEQTEDKLWQLEQALSRHPNATKKQLAEYLGWSESTVKRMKRKLK